MKGDTNLTMIFGLYVIEVTVMYNFRKKLRETILYSGDITDEKFSSHTEDLIKSK